MRGKTTKKHVITIPEVKKILESIGEEQLDRFQRRSLDYAAKFSKVDHGIAGEIAKKLVEQFGIEEEEAVQIVNCMPESIEEIRVFLAGGHKIVETSKLEAILAFLDKYQKKE
jgi:DNA-directed RNA polymerase subunit F